MSKCVIAVVAISVLIAAGLILLVATRHSTLRPTAAVPPTAPLPSSSVEASTNVSGSSSALTAGYITYRNEKYEFEFQYPRSWGDVEFGEASSDGHSFNYVRGLRKPVTGRMFVGNFIKHASCEFSAITPNYTYGSDAPLFVSSGWTEQHGRYYTRWPDSSIRTLVSGRNPEELHPDRVVAVASGTVKELVFEIPLQEIPGEEIDSFVLKAEINLPGPVFRGVGLGCELGAYDDPRKTAEDRQGFELMLHTFFAI